VDAADRTVVIEPAGAGCVGDSSTPIGALIAGDSLEQLGRNSGSGRFER
jgi:hypothetical protein